MEPNEIDRLVSRGHDLIAQTTKAHAQRWGLGDARRWVLDQSQGRITWSFEDRVVSAPAQILGSWNGQVGSFAWAWDNETVQDSLRTTAEQVRAYGIEHDVAALTASPLSLGEPQVRDLVALAFVIGGCSGLYHPYDGTLASYIAFGEVTVEEPGGRVSTYAAPLDQGLGGVG